MTFPLWKFWTYTPWGFSAAVVWNCAEILGVRCPFAPFMFGMIMGKAGRRQP